MAVWLYGCMAVWVYGCMVVWGKEGCWLLVIGCQEKKQFDEIRTRACFTERYKEGTEDHEGEIREHKK